MNTIASLVSTLTYWLRGVKIRLNRRDDERGTYEFQC